MFRVIHIACSWYRWDVRANGWDLRSDVAFPRRRSSGSPGRSKRSGRAQVGSGPGDRPRPTAAMGNSSAQHQPERVVQRSAPSPEDRGDLRLGGDASDVGSHVGTRECVVRRSSALVRRTHAWLPPDPDRSTRAGLRLPGRSGREIDLVADPQLRDAQTPHAVLDYQHSDAHEQRSKPPRSEPLSCGLNLIESGCIAPRPGKMD